MLRPLALLKGYANLVVLCRTACGCGNCSGSRQQKPAKSLSTRGPAERKTETTFSTRGDSRSAAEHRTGYEVSGGQKEIQWQLGISYEAVRLGKRGGLGFPQRLLVTFVRTKVTRVRGGEPREYRPSARGATAEVRYPPHRSRGGRRPKGHSAAAMPLISPRPIRKKGGSGDLPGGFSAHFWAAKSGPAGGKARGAERPQRKRAIPRRGPRQTAPGIRGRKVHAAAGGRENRKERQPCRSQRRSPSASALAAGR